MAHVKRHNKCVATHGINYFRNFAQLKIWMLNKNWQNSQWEMFNAFPMNMDKIAQWKCSIDWQQISRVKWSICAIKLTKFPRKMRKKILTVKLNPVWCGSHTENQNSE